MGVFRELLKLRASLFQILFLAMSVILSQADLFAAPSEETSEEAIGVLVVDSPVQKQKLTWFVEPKLLKKVTEFGLKEKGTEKKPELDSVACQSLAERAEAFFEARLTGSEEKTLELSREEIESLQSFLGMSHGYHVLSTVTADLKKTKVYYLGVAPVVAEDLREEDLYRKKIRALFSQIRNLLKSEPIRVVNYSASESFQANQSDLLAIGLSKSEASAKSRKIVSEWKKQWQSLLKDFPKVVFVVSAGNGGRDWMGDLIADEDAAVPAGLGESNLLRVASLSNQSEECLSKFSNYSKKHVDLATKGESISAYSGCAEGHEVKLSGTSQATARTTNWILKKMEEGIPAFRWFDDLKKSECIKEKVNYGYF